MEKIAEKNHFWALYLIDDQVWYVRCGPAGIEHGRLYKPAKEAVNAMERKYGTATYVKKGLS